jgi:hypothetical protein
MDDIFVTHAVYRSAPVAGTIKVTEIHRIKTTCYFIKGMKKQMTEPELLEEAQKNGDLVYKFHSPIKVRNCYILRIDEKGDFFYIGEDMPVVGASCY